MRVFVCLILLAAPLLAEDVEHFRVRSKLLSKFWKRDMFIEAGIVLPPKHRKKKALAACYNIHGFGGSWKFAHRRAKQLVAGMQRDYPRMIYVYLQAQFHLGHHEFADSANNGPWGAALTTEFIPALEAKYGADPKKRFLTGHSSGGWSSLWLQVAYPDFFSGTWSTAPDSVDFRDFTGIDVYRFENAYADSKGAPNMLMRRGPRFVMSIQQYVTREEQRRAEGGQFQSFDAVFSQKGRDGRPMKMFDRETGRIDKQVAKTWERYDINLILRRNWKTLGPKLKGKLHVYCGTLDTFRLEGAVRLMQRDLRKLGSDAEIILVEGRNHGSLFRPHTRLWPKGMMDRIHREMAAR